jgi:prepilin-type N-terminal cleavage/methylation domain-containing protein
MKSKAGFTLVEIMVASLISVLVVAAIYTIQMMSTRTFAEGTTDARLERLGNMILERIVRGPSGQYGLREARFDTLQVYQSEWPHISYMVDRNDPPTFDTSDDTECSIYVDYEGRIIYDPDTSLDNDEVILNSRPVVHEMNVTKHADHVEIELVLQETVQPFDSAMQVRVSTSVRPRID